MIGNNSLLLHFFTELFGVSPPYLPSIRVSIKNVHDSLILRVSTEVRFLEMLHFAIQDRCGELAIDCNNLGNEGLIGVNSLVEKSSDPREGEGEARGVDADSADGTL